MGRSERSGGENVESFREREREKLVNGLNELAKVNKCRGVKRLKA